MEHDFDIDIQCEEIYEDDMMKEVESFYEKFGDLFDEEEYPYNEPKK